MTLKRCRKCVIYNFLFNVPWTLHPKIISKLQANCFVPMMLSKPWTWIQFQIFLNTIINSSEPYSLWTLIITVEIDWAYETVETWSPSSNHEILYCNKNATIWHSGMRGHQPKQVCHRDINARRVFEKSRLRILSSIFQRCQRSLWNDAGVKSCERTRIGIFLFFYLIL